MIVKNQMVSLTCSRLGSELEGVCDYEGMTVFTPGALPGEQVEARVVKVCANYAFARLGGVTVPSPERAHPPCPVYALCGGCSGQHMTYAATLAAKRAQTLDCLRRIGGFALTGGDVPPVLGAENPWYGRNKTALPVGGTAEHPLLGFYRRRSHMIVPTQRCMVAMEGLCDVVSAVQDWIIENRVPPYNEETGKGLLRHVVVRASRSGSVMIVLTATRGALPGEEALIRLLRKRVPGFCSLHVSVNKARNNVVLGSSSRKLWGEDSIVETLLGRTFEIAPLSFFQVNPAQTEKLYQTAIDFAQLRPEDTVVDAYAGAGTIALCLADRVARVTGMEIVPQAVDSARRNAERNHVANAVFHTGAVEELLPRMVKDGLRPDVVILDPPRKGVEPPVIDAVLHAAPRRVIYVSCHVPTQARDLKLLAAGGYRLAACQPVDMFCYAGGVENVAAMEREGAGETDRYASPRKI